MGFSVELFLRHSANLVFSLICIVTLHLLSLCFAFPFTLIRLSDRQWIILFSP